jgi:hypothetical protein
VDLEDVTEGWMLRTFSNGGEGVHGQLVLGGRFCVSIRLGGEADRIAWVASSGLFSNLEHDRCQMLGLNSRGLLSPEHRGVRRGCEGVESTRKQ